MRIRIIDPNSWPSVALLHQWRQHVGCSAPSLYAGVESGALKSERIGRNTFITRNDMVTWLGGNPLGSGPVSLLTDSPMRQVRRRRAVRRQKKATT
jgi:hypothetical protein